MAVGGRARGRGRRASRVFELRAGSLARYRARCCPGVPAQACFAMDIDSQPLVRIRAPGTLWPCVLRWLFVASAAGRWAAPAHGRHASGPHRAEAERAGAKEMAGARQALCQRRQISNPRKQRVRVWQERLARALTGGVDRLRSSALLSDPTWKCQNFEFLSAYARIDTHVGFGRPIEITPHCGSRLVAARPATPAARPPRAPSQVVLWPQCN
jgi:hypothetical protein